MSLGTVLNQQVEVVHYGPGAEDAFGNPSRTEADRQTVTARLWQIGSTERLTGRDTQVGDWRIILPAFTVFDAGDEIEANGQRFSVLGAPQRVMGARAEHHVEAALTFTEQVS